MKRFYIENSKAINKLVLYQFGAAFLGILMYSAAGSVAWLNLATGVFAILFYMYLIYGAVWDEGARDRIKVDGGRLSVDMWKGVKIAFFANIPNLLIGVVHFIFTTVSVLAQAEWAGNIAFVANAIGVIWEGMYNGIITSIFPRVIGGQYVDLTILQTILRSFSFIVIVLPALLTCNVAYRLGYSGVAVFKPTAKDTEKKK